MKFARFRDEEGYRAKGGTCISSFAIVKRGERFLLVKIAQPELWAERWYLPLEHPERWRGKWQIPCTYLRYGEHPDSAARRVMEEQLGLRSYTIKRMMVESFLSESSLAPGHPHWDLCFIYEGEPQEEVKPQPWLAELRFFSMEEARELELGRGHGDILAALEEPSSNPWWPWLQR